MRPPKSEEGMWETWAPTLTWPQARGPGQSAGTGLALTDGAAVRGPSRAQSRPAQEARTQPAAFACEQDRRVLKLADVVVCMSHPPALS